MHKALGESGLKFFGTMTASLSHEIKNRIAVINEHAGLLKDMVGRAQKGYDLDIERLDRLADDMARQIGLTDGIIGNMNRFGHSADRIEPPADLNEWLPLAAVLFQRLADGRNALLETRLTADETWAPVPPFYLLALIRHCLDKTLAVAQEPYSVVLEGRKQAAGATVCLGFPAGGMADVGGQDLTVGDKGGLLTAFQAKIDVPPGENKVLIRLPSG